MAQAGCNPTTRRALMAGAPVAAVALTTCAAPAQAFAAGEDDPRIAALHREADALVRETARMNSAPRSQDEWDAFAERRDAGFLDQVKALPETPAYAVIRARAIALIYGDDEEMFDTDTTDARLAAQIVRSLLKGAVR